MKARSGNTLLLDGTRKVFQVVHFPSPNTQTGGVVADLQSPARQSCDYARLRAAAYRDDSMT